MPEGIPSEYPIEVNWEGEMRYRGGRAGGEMLLLDGSGQAAPSPVQGLLVSLASCSAIDVVDILSKRRTPPTDLSVLVEFSRAPHSPRRLTAVHLRFRLRTASTREHIQRAIELSLEKYCSVATSLAPDIQLSWDIELEAAEEDASVAAER